MEVQDMSFEEYEAHPGINFSSLKDFAVSPLRYWHRWLRPDREPEPESEYLRFGHAVHTAVLEPAEFEKRYARAIDMREYDGCLRTVEDLREFMVSRGYSTKGAGTRKKDVIAAVLKVDAQAPILDLIEADHAEKNKGRIILPFEEFDRVRTVASAVAEEPAVQRLLEGCQFEVSLFEKDPDTGLMLKGRIDAKSATRNIDAKTFTQRRGSTIDKSINDAIFYEFYYAQAVFYAKLRGWPDQWKSPEHVMIFCESDPPHEVRIKVMRPAIAGQASLLWMRGDTEIKGMLRLMKQYLDKFGTERPWRYAADAEPVLDEEIKALAFS